jgi:predicted ATPase with chaperone activity
MLLGDILVSKGLITREQVNQAVERQTAEGGRLGENLIAVGAISPEVLQEVMEEWPQQPRNLDDIDIDETIILGLIIKGMYSQNLELPSQIARAIALPGTMVTVLMKELVDRKMVEAAGQADSGAGALSETRYTLSRTGREYGTELFEQNGYFGPAPVTLESYTERILRQRISNEVITREQIREAFEGLVIPERFLGRLGPAVNSGTAVLIYGPAGNGKTTVAEIVGKIFQNVIYVPYCIEVDGEIINIFDPTIHLTVETESDGGGARTLRREGFDRRWVPCERPMVITGGELTLDMLDLKFNEIAKFYEAPMHIKAINGTFLIDDFGRQRVAPEDILNRWIVPLNSRVDYLQLHTGKTIEVPFDELVIFSTNLHPNDLMDPAFQRRIAYKLETLEPSEELFREVFQNMAKARGLELTDEIFQMVRDEINANEQPLAYFQPKFIVDQVLATCKFEGMSPQFTRENVEDAMLNLFVKSESQMFGVSRGG